MDAEECGDGVEMWIVETPWLLFIYNPGRIQQPSGIFLIPFIRRGPECSSYISHLRP